MHASAKTLARRQLERQIIEDGTAIWKSKREIESLLAAEEKKQQWMMLAAYNPWGKPGHGAPMPGALRKTKWIFDAPPAEKDVDSAVTLGRPGHGAPLRTSSGKTKTFIKADPLIRFQLHDSARRTVENDLRYRATPNDKENYRRELDAIVCEKKQKKTEEVSEETPCEKQKMVVLYAGNKNYLSERDIWGRPGPGGRAWRDPKKIGSNFFRSMGWTNNAIFNKLTKESHPEREREQIYEITGGGVELVPLLAKHRMVTRCPLSTTDITRMSRICNDLPKAGVAGREYFRQLCHQIDEREKQKQKEQKEEIEESQKHFETWKGFWGRPGHGAPKALSQREKLELLLYRMPSRRIISTTTTTTATKSP